MENSTPTKKKKSFFESPLLSSKVKSANVKIFPEGGLGFFIGPTLALLANSILGQYFNMYMTNVLNITAWASTFFTWLPVISVIFVVAGNIVVGRLMDKSRTKAGKARPLLLVSVPLSILALLILFIISPCDGHFEYEQPDDSPCLHSYRLQSLVRYRISVLLHISCGARQSFDEKQQRSFASRDDIQRNFACRDGSLLDDTSVLPLVVVRLSDRSRACAGRLDTDDGKRCDKVLYRSDGRSRIRPGRFVQSLEDLCHSSHDNNRSRRAHRILLYA